MTIYTNVTGEGKDIVLIHGWGCQHQHMQPMADHLAKHFRVTNIDLPGRGHSDWSDDIKSIDDMADAILPVLPEKAIYVVNSIGGLVTFSIASRYPERVERVIGIGTTPRFIEDDNWPGFPKPGFFSFFEPIVKKEGMEQNLIGFYDGEFADFDPKPEVYHQIVEVIKAGPIGDDAAFLKGLNIVDNADLRDVYKAIQQPVDLIIGSSDAAVPVALIEPLQALKPEAVIHNVPGGHMPFLSYPKQFFAVLDKLLSL